MFSGDQATLRYSGAPMPTGIASGVGFAAAIVATGLAVALHATHDVSMALIPLGLVTAVVATLTSWTGALATAWMCWLLDSGFVIGREAQLTFSPAAQLAALVLVGVALAAGIGGRMVRARRPESDQPAILVRPAQSWVQPAQSWVQPAQSWVQPIQSWNDRPETFS